jgi:TolB-like protein/Tfp pilus assembly protein PilF
MSERLVPDLAGAVLDGTPIDWAGAESSADETSRPVLAELKVLAALADVHRQQSHQDGAGPGDQADTLTRWGHLRALERIGSGAFGEVYRAWDTRLDREVALKLIDADHTTADDSSSSIIHEGRLLARVRHPNVVTIYGAERIGARIGLWMEFVRGRSLKQIVGGGKVFSGAEAIQIGIDVAHAVAAVHGAGVLHRDVKAQNVMLAEDGRAVLMDFGTGRELLDNDSADVAGTPLYLAPEVLAGSDATIQSDVYSLGVLLYFLVTSSYPVRGQSVSDLRLAHQRHERIPIRAARHGSKLSPKLARIIERAIDPRPDGRYAGADALAADLAALQLRPALARLTYATGAAAVLLLIVGLGWEAVGRRVGSSRTPSALLASVAGRSAAVPQHVIPSQPIIAVLPFENLSDEPGSDDFVDGLTDEIIRTLSAIQGLHVRSRGSSFVFTAEPRDLRDVGQQLGVNLVLEGSVLRSGNKLHVNARLIQVAGNVSLWSDQFDRELEDIFAILDEISRAIANKLQLTLGRAQRRYETNVDAYELYLKGRALIGRRGRNDVDGAVPSMSLENAAEVFRQVLVKDPEFAPAHAGLATAYALMSLLPTGPPGTLRPVEITDAIVRPAAEKALDLDPLLADAHAAMALVHVRDLDWSAAQKAFQRALELNRSLTHVYTSYSYSTLRPLGKWNEALRLLRVALQNDPFSLDVQREIGAVQLDAGQYEEAINTLERVRAVEPDFPYVDIHLAVALVLAGRPAEALSVFERIDRLSGRPRRAPQRALAYVALGRRAEAEALAAEHADGLPSALVQIYAALGDKDRAFDALERMAVIQPLRMPLQLVMPGIASLRGDPRLGALRQRFHLPPQ